MNHQRLGKNLTRLFFLVILFLSACTNRKTTEYYQSLFEKYQPYSLFPTKGRGLFLGVTETSMELFSIHFLGEIVEYESQTGLTSQRCFSASFDKNCLERHDIEEQLGSAKYLLLLFEGDIVFKKIYNDSKCHDGNVVLNRILFASPQTTGEIYNLCRMTRAKFEDYWSSEEYIKELIGQVDNGEMSK